MPSPFRHLLGAAALGLFALCAAPAHAGPSSLYVFGDSLSDGGNNALATAAITKQQNGVPQAITGNSYIPTFPYMPQPGWNNASGFATYSNGNTWATNLAAQLGVSGLPSLAGGTNYAFGGARVAIDGSPNSFPPSLSTQVNMALFAAGGALDSTALYVVAGGGNDARAVLGQVTPMMTLPDINNLFFAAAAQFAASIDNLLDTLQGAGAKDIVVWNVPNLGLAPAVTAQGPLAAMLGTALTTAMNAALELAMQDESDVAIFDLFGLVTAMDATPGAFGLLNTKDACGAAVNQCDPSTAIFWDGIHPTAMGHQLLAKAMADQVIPEPGSAWLVLVALVGLGRVMRRRAA